MARNIAVVGNGGISLEIIHSLPFCKIEWIIRDSNIGSTFFDEYSSRFLIPTIYTRMKQSTKKSSMNINQAISSSTSKQTDIFLCQKYSTGAALGPEWLHASGLLGNLSTEITQSHGYIQVVLLLILARINIFFILFLHFNQIPSINFTSILLLFFIR